MDQMELRSIFAASFGTDLEIGNRGDRGRPTPPPIQPPRDTPQFTRRLAKHDSNVAVLASNRAVYDREYRALALGLGLDVDMEKPSGSGSREGFSMRRSGMSDDEPPHAPSPFSLETKPTSFTQGSSEDTSWRNAAWRRAEASARARKNSSTDQPAFSKDSQYPPNFEFSRSHNTCIYQRGANQHGCSATSAPPSLGVPNNSSRLSAEILLLIFEELANTPELRGMRLVSRQFDNLLVPIVYRHVIITPKFVTAYQPYVQDRYVHDLTPLSLHMALYTKQVTVNRKLDSEQVLTLLEDLTRLDSIKWSYIDRQEPLAQPFYLLNRYHMIQTRAAKATLSVERLPAKSVYRIENTMIQPWTIASLELVDWERSHTRDVEQTLLRHPELGTVHLIAKKPQSATERVYFHDRRISPGARLPAVKELLLENYYWDHSPHVAVTFWDWTKITHLTLINVNITRFLRSVPPHHLIRLKDLSLSGDRKEQYGELTSLICDLVHKIHALQMLSIRCKIRGAITSLFKHSLSLRSLHLYDCSRPGSPNATTLCIADIEAINAMCPHIMELSLEVHWRSEERPANALHIDDHALCEMRNLRRLRLHTRMAQSSAGVPPSVEGIYAHINRILQNWLASFLPAKKGASFEYIAVHFRIDGVPEAAVVYILWKYEVGKELKGAGPDRRRMGWPDWRRTGLEDY